MLFALALSFGACGSLMTDGSELNITLCAADMVETVPVRLPGTRARPVRSVPLRVVVRRETGLEVAQW